MIGPHDVDEWMKLTEPQDGSRLELIYGYYHMTQPPTGEHQRASYKIANLLDELVTTADVDLHMVQGVGVNISTGWRTALIPDVVLLNVPGDLSQRERRRSRMGAALWRHSRHSASGSESAVIPPPTPSQTWSSANSRVRIATFIDRPATGEAIPIAPV